MALKRVPATLTAALLAVGAAVSAAQAAASPPSSPIRVEYVHPEKFRDAGSGYPGSDRSRAGHLEQLRAHLLRRAGPLLEPGQQLAVVITDVDMAGSFEPWRPRLDGVRIVRDLYPPRIELRFELTDAGGGIIKSGERSLSDPAFLMTTAAYRDDPLRYEKTLLDEWLARDLRPASSGPSSPGK